LAPNPALPKDQPLRGRWFNVDGVLLQTHINHANRYAVVGEIQALFFLQTHIIHVNRYAVVVSMQMLFLLQTRINHVNRYAIVGAINVVYDLHLLNSYGFLS